MYIILDTKNNSLVTNRYKGNIFIAEFCLYFCQDPMDCIYQHMQCRYENIHLNPKNT